MALSRDFAAFFDDDAIEYKGIKSKAHPAGKTYRVAAPDARTGLWLAGLADLAGAVLGGATVSDTDRKQLQLDDDDEKTLYQRVLGSTFDELLQDEVSWPTLKRIGRDAYLVFAMDESVADSVLAGSQGEAPAPEQGAKSGTAAPRKAGSRSSRASGGTPARTRSRASTPSSKTPGRAAKTA